MSQNHAIEPVAARHTAPRTPTPAQGEVDLDDRRPEKTALTAPTLRRASRISIIDSLPSAGLA